MVYSAGQVAATMVRRLVDADSVNLNLEAIAERRSLRVVHEGIRGIGPPAVWPPR